MLWLNTAGVECTSYKKQHNNIMLNLHARGLLEHGKPNPCVWGLALKAAEYKIVLYRGELWQLQSIIITGCASSENAPEIVCCCNLNC